MLVSNTACHSEAKFLCLDRLQPRRAAGQRTSLLPVDLITEARALGLNISEACERGLKAEIARSRATQWLEQNQDALTSSNDYVERNGLPLAGFRQNLMGRFDVYPTPGRGGLGYVLDVQADLLTSLRTRVVVHLLPPDAAPKPARSLNPAFLINGETHLMLT